MKIVKKVLFILIIIFLLIIAFIFFSHEKVTLTLIGNKNISIKLNEVYIEPGVTAKSCTIFHCRDITKELITKGKINNTKTGTYQLKYSIDDTSITRNIEVIDDIAPVINLDGHLEITMCPNQEYIEEGYSAYDNYDQDLTDNVTKQIKNDTIYYEVKDSSNNTTNATRKLIFEDNESPIINLKGNEVIEIDFESQYVEPGFIVSDNCSTDLEKKSCC